jgi:molybdate transport system substrate-binding protein
LISKGNWEEEMPKKGALCPGRRAFLQTAALAALGAALPAGPAARDSFVRRHLQVWSCGGLAEALIPAHQLYEQQTGVKIAYTGAFAAALGKSLLGRAQTEVFAGRVLELARKLRRAGKMLYFKPLCFTSYVLVTPKGNPAGIDKIQDLARPGVKVVLAPKASPPGGAAVQAILKKAGILAEVLKNAVTLGSCVQRTMMDIVTGKGDVSVVELRLTRLPEFLGRTEIVPLPESLFPLPPLTFTVGVMKHARDRALADHYVDFLTSPSGQAFFTRQGFIPAGSDRGQELIERLGVKDV